MSMKMLKFLRFFCCILVLVSSAKSNDKEDDGGEENKNELDKINEVLTELKATIVKNKLHGDQADVLHDQQIKQLLMEQNRSKERADKLEVEINHINQVVNELIGKTNSSFPIKKPENCNRSLDEFYEHEKPDYTWVITDLKKKLKQRNFEMLSEVFPLREYPFGAQAKIYRLHEYLLIELSFKRGNESDDSLLLEILPAVVYIFKNHSKNFQPSDRVIRHESEMFNTTLQFDASSYTLDLIVLESTHNPSYQWIPKYWVSDTASIDIYVEPEWSQQACSYDGTLSWIIEDYKKKLEMEKDFRISYQVSPYFYTGLKGYRMQVFFFLDGIGETRGIGLMASVSIINGPNDQSLDQSFNLRTTVTLLHPTDPAKHIAKSVEQRGIEQMPNFLMYMGNHEEIETLLVNDTLYYNVTVVKIETL